MTMPETSKNKRLSRLALALEPRMMFDAAAVTTAVEVAAEAVVVATTEAPGANVTPINQNVVITDSTDSFPPVDLFKDVNITLDNGGEKIKELVITIDRSGSSEALVIDGQKIELTQGNGGFTETSQYSYTVTISGKVTTITLNFEADGGISAEDAKQLIDGIAYQAQDKTVAGGPVKITLASLTDMGGQSLTVDATATVTIDNRINVAPELDSDGGLDTKEKLTPNDLGISSNEVSYSADGKFLYVAGNNGIRVFSVDASGALTALQSFDNNDLGSISRMVASSDGKSLYTISGNGNVVHLSLGADGKIASVATVETQNGNAKGGLSISADGAYVYAGTEWNDVVIYRRDTDTGALTLIGRAANNGRNGIVATGGDYVYVLYTSGPVSHTLALYQRNADGTLSHQLNLNTDIGGGFGAVDYAMTVSADGKMLYVANPENGTIAIFSLSGAGDTKEVKEVVRQQHDGVKSLALSADGKTLYAAGNGSVTIYRIGNDGSLSKGATTEQGAGNGSAITIAADGSLVVAGDGLTRYASIQVVDIGKSTNFADKLNLSDSNFDALAADGNYKGASITVTPSVNGGTFSFAPDNGLELSDGVIKQNGTAIASFTVDGDGKLTVTFTADTSKAVANQVLGQLTYAMASNVTPGSLMSLAVQVSDGTLSSAVTSLVLYANSVPQPSPDSHTLPSVTTETDYNTVLPETLFTDADGNTLRWSITGLPEGLSFDPATRTISGKTTVSGGFTVKVTVTDVHGATATRDLTLEVGQIDNRAPVVNPEAPDTLTPAVADTDYSNVLDAAIFSDADSIYADSKLNWSISGLPDGITFDAATRTLSGKALQAGDFTVKITVTDEHGATAEHTLTLRVISQAESDNRAPTINADGSDLTYTSDGRINGYDKHVYSVEVSADGRTVTVLGNSSNSHGITPEGNSILSIFSRNPKTGVLTLLQQFVQGTADDGNAANGLEINGLDSAASATYSADGKQLYLAGKPDGSGNYVLTVFNVNADGTLTPSGQTVELGSDTVKQMAISNDGKLYIAAGNTLHAFQAGADGVLSRIATLADQPFKTAHAITVDSKGFVYVVGTNTLTIYKPGTDGALEKVVERSGDIGNFGRSIAVSDKYIYISTGTTGILALQYDQISQSVTKIASMGSQIWGLELSANGKTLYAGTLTGGLNIYAIGDDGAPKLVKTVAQRGDTGAYRAFRFAISADGTSIYAGGFYNASGLAHIDTGDAVDVPYFEGTTIHPAADLTLSDADNDALANGAGNYKNTTITLAREGGLKAEDAFGFKDDNGLTLAENELRLDGQKIADFTIVDGKLSIAFTADATKATANAVLQQITYTNANNEPEASIRLVLGVKDQFANGTDSMVLVLGVTQVNDAPTIEAETTPRTIEAGETSGALFSNVTISTVESGQQITSLTFTVSGVKNGANEILRINGQQLALKAGSTTAAGYTFTVTVEGDAATVVVSHAGISGADAATLIEGITYSHANADTAILGERTVALVSVKDNGGTDNGGSDTLTITDLAVVVTVTEEKPTINADPGALELAKQIELIGEDGYTNQLEGVKDVLHANGKVYVIRTTTEFVWDEATQTGEDKTISTLYIFDKAADGTLTFSQSIAATSENGMIGANTLGLSADGKMLHVITDSGVALFSRDVDTGALTAQGSLSADLGLVSDVVIKGDVAYVTSVTGLSIFSRSADGWTKTGEAIRPAGDDAWFTTLRLSADGKLMFASISGGDTLAAVFRVGDDGVLTLAGTAGSGEPNATTLLVADDGKTLYVADGETLYIVDVAEDGTPTVRSSLTLDATVKQVLLTQDGKTLLLVGTSEVMLYTRAADGNLKLAATVEGVGEPDFMGDPSVSFREIKGASLSADGKQLYLSGTFGWNDGLLVLDLKPADVTYIEDGSAVIILPGGTLEDKQLDAKNNGKGDYNGASIVIERQDGANAEDLFGFLDANGLTLDAGTGKISLNGTEVATLSQVDGKLTLMFSVSISQADAQNVLRQITYTNTSNDPGASAQLRITLNDGDGNSDAMDVVLTLEGRNDKADVKTDVLPDRKFKAEGERIKLFENTQIDTIEAGQKIARVVITIEPADSKDVLGIGAGKILLDKATSDVAKTETGLEYQITIAAGKATVMLFLMGTPEKAAELIDSLTYGNTGGDLSGTRTIGLSVVEDVDWQHPAPKNDVSEFAQKAVITLEAAASPNTKPIWNGATDGIEYKERSDAINIVPNAISIADTQMDAFNGGKGNYDGAELKISLGEGKSSADVLRFNDGNDLSLNGEKLMKGGKAIGSVMIADGVLTIRFSDAAGEIPTTEDVNNALKQITYANNSYVPVSSVAVSITLIDQQGLASEPLAYGITIEAVNDAPVIDIDPERSLGDLESLQTLDPADFGLSDLSTSIATADGKRVYIADAQGRIALFSRNTETGALTHVETFASQATGTAVQLQLSADGNSLLALQKDTDRSNASTVVWYTVDAEGKLQQPNSLSGLFDLKGMTLSADGKNLYLIDNYTVKMYGRDASTGNLTHMGDLDQSMTTPPYLWAPTEITVRDNLVYVVTNASNGSTLIVFQRDADGNLTALTHLHSGETDANGKTITLTDIQHVTVSADGRTIFISNGETRSLDGTAIKNAQKIDAFRLDTATGKLTHLGTIADTPTVNDIALSADGKVLMVTRDNGSLAYYSAVTLNKMSSSQSGLNGASNVILLQDGGVLTLGDALQVLRIKDIPDPTFNTGKDPITPFPAFDLSDPELDANGYKDAQLVIVADKDGSKFGFSAKDGYALNAEGTKIMLNGTEIATYTLSADGKTLTIVFADGATKAQANAVLRQVSYAWEGTGSPGKAVLDITMRDQAGDTGKEASRTVDVSINTAPEVSDTVKAALDAEGVLQRDTGAAIDFRNIFVDADGAALTVVLDGELPPGLTFDPANGGSLTGTLQTAGKTVFTLTATDIHGISVTLQITLQAANVPPTIDIQPINPTYIENADPLPVFDDVSIDLHGASETVKELTLSLKSFTDTDHEILTIDGTAIVLRAGASGQTQNGHNYVIVQDGDALTLTLTAGGDGLQAAQANALLEGISYSSTSDNPSVEQARSITLVSIRDSGSTAGGGTNLVEPGVETRIQIEAVNDAPVSDVDTLPGLNAKPGSEFSYTLPENLFTDPEGDAFSLTVTGLPAGLTFDAATGKISGTLDAAAVGRHEIVITATDAHGASSSVTLVLQAQADTHTDTNNAPVPGGTLPALDAEPGREFSYTLPEKLFTDPDGDAFSLTVTGLPSGLTFDAATGTISGMPGAAAVGRHAIVITATDARGASSSVTLVLQVQADPDTNNAPVPGGTLPALEAKPGREFSYTLPEKLFTDPDGDTFSLTVTGLPSGLTFDAATGTISGTPGAAAVGRHAIVITATDARGASSSVTLVLQVQADAEANNAPVPGGTLPALDAEPGREFSYTLPEKLFTDPDGDAFSLTVTGLPSGLTFDAATGAISGTPGAAAVGGHAIVITATDARGASSSVTLALQVNASTDGATLPQILPDSALSRDASALADVSVLPLADAWQSDAAQRHQTLADAWAGVSGFDSRPLGYSSLTMAGLSADPGLRGLPFYLTDAPRSEWERELGQRQAERSAATSLVGHDGGLLVARDTVRGTAQWDALQGHYQYQLPDGLFAGRQALVSVVLVQADGSPLPEGIRLDARTGRIVVAGIGGQWDLVLVAQTQDGRSVQVPVLLTVPESAADVAAEGRPADTAISTGAPLPEVKAAVSDQIRMQAAPSLAQDALRLLVALGAEPQQDAVPDAQKVAA